LVITVDFDLMKVREYIEDKERDRTEYEVIFYILRWNYVCKKERCKICLTGKGLHLYIYRNVDFMKEIPLRIWLGDDIMRLEIDIKRYFKKLYGFIDTLFSEKIEKNHYSKEICIDFNTFFVEFLKRFS